MMGCTYVVAVSNNYNVGACYWPGLLVEHHNMYIATQYIQYCILRDGYCSRLSTIMIITN